MTDITTLLDEMEKAARKATPGKWKVADRMPEGDFGEQNLIETDAEGAELDGMIVGTMFYDGLHLACTDPNATHIALCSPSNILRLVEWVRDQADWNGFEGSMDAIARAVWSSDKPYEEWEYPGQVVRDAEALRARAEKAEAKLEICEAANAEMADRLKYAAIRDERNARMSRLEHEYEHLRAIVVTRESTIAERDAEIERLLQEREVFLIALAEQEEEEA